MRILFEDLRFAAARCPPAAVRRRRRRDPGPRHRRQRRPLQRGGRRPAEAAALPRPRPARDRVGERPPARQSDREAVSAPDFLDFVERTGRSRRWSPASASTGRSGPSPSRCASRARGRRELLLAARREAAPRPDVPARGGAPRQRPRRRGDRGRLARALRGRSRRLSAGACCSTASPSRSWAWCRRRRACPACATRSSSRSRSARTTVPRTPQPARVRAAQARRPRWPRRRPT